MSIEERILEKVRGLPDERQREVLDFVEFVERKASQNGGEIPPPDWNEP